MRRLAVTLLFLLVPLSGRSQPQNEVVRVATRVVKPFVFEEAGQLTGFSIELWQEISSEMKIKSEFLVKPTVQDLLNSVKSNET